MSVEIWKDVPGYEGYYQVSNIGRVKSLSRIVERFNNSPILVPETIIKSFAVHGYRTVRFYISGKVKVKQFRVHRLVGMAFIPNPENKPYINHKNGIKHDNRLENLEWCTAQENTKHMYEVLGFKFSDAFKERQRELMNDRLENIRQKIICIEDNRVFSSATEAGKFYGIAPGSIKNLAYTNGTSKFGKSFKHYTEYILGKELSEAHSEIEKLRAENSKIRKALENSVAVIRHWHGESAFDIYYECSPEMKPIREALK